MEQEYKQIVLVDDHTIVLDGLKELIEKLGPYQVCAMFNNGRALLDALPLESVPDLIIMDISMPVMDGEETIQALNDKGISIPVLILTLNHDEDQIVRLFRLDVRGYLEKNCTAAIMREALTEIFKRGFYHNDVVSLALRAPKQSPKTERDQILEQLTEREKLFLRLVCDDAEYTYDQIADLMGVVKRTVDGYRESIFQKFSIRSKTGLVLFAVRHNLVDNTGRAPRQVC